MASPRALLCALSTHWDTVEFLVRERSASGVIALELLGG